jgi:Holliday junction DNA helicase RuvA
MIGLLKGKVIHSNEIKLILETAGGIGYEIFFRGIMSVNQIASIFISHQFKESGQELYGFSTMDEKNCFESLLSVKGVGPKLAFNILKNLDVGEIYTAIYNKEQKTFKSVSGVGNKVAAQIILDLSGKILDFSQIELKKIPNTSPVTDMKGSDALVALKNLGLNEEKVLPIVQNILKANSDVASSEEIVKIVLRNLHQ